MGIIEILIFKKILEYTGCAKPNNVKRDIFIYRIRLDEVNVIEKN